MPDLRDIQAKLHNRLAGEIVKAIVRPIYAAGGGGADCAIILESLIVGVILTTALAGADDAIVDSIATAAKARLKTLRAERKAGTH